MQLVCCSAVGMVLGRPDQAPSMQQLLVVCQWLQRLCAIASIRSKACAVMCQPATALGIGASLQNTESQQQLQPQTHQQPQQQADADGDAVMSVTEPATPQSVLLFALQHVSLSLAAMLDPADVYAEARPQQSWEQDQVTF